MALVVFLLSTAKQNFQGAAQWLKAGVALSSGGQSLSKKKLPRSFTYFIGVAYRTHDIPIQWFSPQPKECDDIATCELLGRSCASSVINIRSSIMQWFSLNESLVLPTRMENMEIETAIMLHRSFTHFIGVDHLTCDTLTLVLSI